MIMNLDTRVVGPRDIPLKREKKDGDLERGWGFKMK